MPVRCNNHPWMNAFINVSATPFFAVTRRGWAFEISGLPAGTYTLAAVHEKMGEQTMTVTVEPKGTGQGGLHLASSEIETEEANECRMAVLAAAIRQQVRSMDFNLALVVHRLPFWFLVFALFLPRVALVVAWLQGVLLPFHLNGMIPLLFCDRFCRGLWCCT